MGSVILGSAALVLGTAASVLGAAALGRRLRTGDAAVDWVVFLLLRLALISAAVLVAGSLGILTPWGLGSLAVLSLAALVALKAHRCLEFPRIAAPPRVVMIALTVVGVRLLAQVWLFAPYTYDALSYHLTKVGEWVRAGGFTPEMGVDTHAPFPAGFELIEAWWVVFLRHDVLIEMAGVEFLALAFAAVCALAGRAGLSDREASIAGLLYLLTPGVHHSATSCLNDVPVAALFLSAAALIAARAPLPVLALALGLGIGTKPVFAYALPGLAWMYWRDRSEPAAGPPPQRRLVVGLLALAAAVGLYWYGRNALWYGNPIHPVGARGLLAETGETKIQFGPSLGNGIRNLLSLVDERIYDRATAYSPLLVDISGWGGAALSCGMIGLAAALRAAPEMRRLALPFAISLVSVLVLVNHDRWYLRFVLFFPALLAIAAARLTTTVRESLLVLVPCLAFQFLATFVPWDLPARSVREMAAMDWHGRSAAKGAGAWSEEATVAFYGLEPYHNRGESYYLFHPDFSRRIVYLRSKTVDGLLDEMRRGGADVLYQARPSLAFPGPVEAAEREGRLRSIGERWYRRVD